jgi:hypothetical protein
VSRQASGVLTTKQREQYEREGYLILESVDVPAGTLDAVVEDLDGLYVPPSRTEAGVGYGAHRISNAWKRSPNVKAVALASNVLRALEELYGRSPIGFHTLNFWKGTQQAAHSDTLHFNSDPPGFMCGVWVALEDIGMDQGPVVYYPGSHKLPEVTMQDVGVHADPSEYKRYEAHIADLIQHERLEERYATIPKGHAFIWAANLLHGGSKWNDRSLTRHSQVTHYFFEGCRFWQPMTSDGDHVTLIEFDPIA